MVANPQVGSQSMDDWELIVNIENIIISQLDTAKYDLDVSIQTDFIAVEITGNNFKPTWVNGGYIGQIYQFDDTVLIAEQHFLAVNQINLIKLNKLAPIPFGLIYDPPRYFDTINIKVWQYTGVQTDLLLQDIANGLEGANIIAEIDTSAIENKLNRLEVIEAKLDLLLNQFNLQLPFKPITVTSGDNIKYYKFLRII